MKKAKTNYAYTPENNDKAVKAAMKNAKISYKNTHQTVTILRGMWLTSAIKYMDDVLARQRCIPMRKYNGGVPRRAQAKEFGVLQGRWPEKSVTQVKSILKSMQKTAVHKGLDASKMKIMHAQVQRAPIIHNRTYRAHGRVTAWNKSPCHIELVAEEQLGAIPAEKPVASIAQKRAERRNWALAVCGRLRAPSKKRL
ncbi:large subunit ribosomal protein L17e [Nematocida homosporus]|uniref:large subunit ribosomal protein L17e n=1 Tax=Nematocida homosporus TaxID=1912981 RepID=UPI00221E48C8|nr:large subunit ribosomal protein L17e [Nematocida homosporus]KAI5186103.1 large subunit ribosomal protein L17e [Nematocida homosporus]